MVSENSDHRSVNDSSSLSSCPSSDVWWRRKSVFLFSSRGFSVLWQNLPLVSVLSCDHIGVVTAGMNSFNWWTFLKCASAAQCAISLFQQDIAHRVFIVVLFFIVVYFWLHK